MRPAMAVDSPCRREKTSYLRGDFVFPLPGGPAPSMSAVSVSLAPAPLLVSWGPDKAAQSRQLEQQLVLVSQSGG